MGFTQFFMNPAFVPAGMALVASPIIIHLINRMRFRKVRFAAMEFLLKADQRNRRRLLLEQLLLLLLRILIVLALLALIARLILDPRLTVFGGEGKAHHLVVLDDSASMKNRWGDTNAFDEAKQVILKLVREGATRPQTQKFSMVLLSKPNDFLYSQVDVSDELAKDLQEKLENMEPSFERPDLQTGLEIAAQHLNKDEATIKHLHVFSDFRETDWQGKEALGDVVNRLEENEISVNLVRSIDQALPNLGITTLEGDLHSAAVGVPVRLRVGVTNFGKEVVENVSVTVVQDGDKLPLSIAIDKINPGEEETRHKDITFTTEGLHQIRVEIGEDSLSVDNARHLSINIPKQNYVLIVTNDTVGDAAFALEAALAPSLELTGIATNVIQADFLESELEDKGLSQFRAIYMLGVPSIPAKPLELLESYVRSGGGLVWFLGDKINVDAYNRMSHLVPSETGELERETDEEGNEIEALFPVYLSNTPGVLERDATTTTPDLNFKSHPVFDDTFNKANNLVSVVRITGFQPVSEEWEEDDRQRNDGVSTVGYTREGHPLVFDHRFGKGRVMTFLTSAGPPWNNLIEIGGIYAPLVQYLQLYVAKPDEEKHEHAIGDVFERTFPALDYENTINWLHPTIGLQEFSMEHPVKEAAEDEVPAEGDGEAEEKSPPATELDTTLWVTRYKGLTVPGVYHYKLIPKSSGQGTQRAVWEFACNVAPEEGESAIASDDTIREHLSPETRVAIHAYGDEGFIAPGTDPGQEVRKYLMYILLFLFVAEQAMAYRLSYHPEPVEAVA